MHRLLACVVLVAVLASSPVCAHQGRLGKVSKLHHSKHSKDRHIRHGGSGGSSASFSSSTSALDNPIPNPIPIGDKNVTREGSTPDRYSHESQRMIDLFLSNTLSPPLISAVSMDFRTQEEADNAIAQPVDAAYAARYGDVAIFIAGFTGWPPSASFLFRLAKYSKRVVIIYQNLQDSSLNVLRKPKVIDGVRVPSSIADKILAYGDGDHRQCLDKDQAADLVIHVIGLMAANKDTLMGNVDVLTAPSTLIGHSQGSFAITMAKLRMTEAGIPLPNMRLVTLGGGLGPVGGPGGSKMTALFNFFSSLAKVLGAEHSGGGRYVSFAKDFANGKIDTKKWRDLVTLGVGSSMMGNEPCFPGATKSCVRPSMLAGSLFGSVIAAGKDPIGAIKGFFSSPPPEAETDGIMPLSVAMAGKKTYRLRTPHDHAYQLEDWHVVDEIARQIPTL